MGFVNKQIGWSNESKLLQYILKQLVKLTAVINGGGGSSYTPPYKIYSALVTKLNDTNPPVVEILENTIGEGISIESYFASNTHILVNTNGLVDTSSSKVIATFNKGNDSPSQPGLFTNIRFNSSDTYLIEPYSFVYVVTVPSGPQALGTTNNLRPMVKFLLEIRVYN